ncbi:adenylate/guanylate cyclase domain-containing protein [Spirulina sp. CS-785/01]|uniref:adenylate/guanylate cyclase domain-containing protein n=1 Tax=Spirulina sp. CS-785/01 TaxID=3021716 RepID=UPI00232B411A|nr:adenylate/guanylate cyclase domain-containing protein [Spirulina sp. CS-785/01]MDB9313427.1 adenylate/guanylate cyclase domain-containing protein [Spirulina sp. CS-785/01]
MSYFLVFHPKTATERVYKLQWGINTLGRSPHNLISIPHNSLSRRHATIVVERDRLILKDLKSLNGTFVNQTRITEKIIKDGDRITCGLVDFLLIDSLNESETTDQLDTEGIKIVQQVSPQQKQVSYRDFLAPKAKQDTALKLRESDDTQRSVDKLKILLEISKELSSPEDSNQLLEKVLDLLLEIISVDRAAILLVHENTGKLQQKAARSRNNLSVNYQFYSTKIINYVYRKQTAVLTDDAKIDQRFEGSQSILSQAIRASMCVPLQPKDNVIGVLYVDNLSQSKAYTQEDLEFLIALANQAAIAIENTRLTNQMREEAVWRDKLERFFPATVSRKLREAGNLDIIETEITALFADISNFTQMSSTMQPREVIEMLNDYFNVMVEEIVFAKEGTLEKYIGDALLAIWGAPYPQENDADRAVQAAIEMQYAVRRLNREWQEKNRQPIAIHIGLNTGPVAAGNIGSKRLLQYAAIGDTTNVTSRICNVAKANQILLSQNTVDKLTHDLPLEKLPLIRVKGKKHPLQLYRLHWKKINTHTTIPTPEEL